jgi:DNA gyrase subunit A
VNLLELGPEAEIASVVPERDFSDDRYLLFCTRKGVVKKTALSAYGNVRNVGLNAMNIREGDEIIDVQVTNGDDQVILATKKGLAIRFNEKDARRMGRATEGVRGIRLQKDDEVVGMVVIQREDASLLVVTETGMGKRTDVDAYRLQGRGGKGVINMRVSERTGDVVAIKSVVPEDQVMVITKAGVVNRQSVAAIREIGRATQGVRLVNLDKGDTVVDVARIIVDDEEDLEGVDGEDMGDSKDVGEVDGSIEAEAEGAES